MPKTNKTELVRAQIAPLNRTEQATEFKRLIAEVVAEQVKAAMSGPNAVFEPWFGSKEVAQEIKRRQTIAEQQKFSNCFTKYGCAVCSTRSVPHLALAMCARCYRRLHARLDSVIREHSAPGSTMPTFGDTMRLAQEALAPTSETDWQALPETAGPAPSYRSHAEAAREAGVNPDTLYTWIQQGKVQRPATKIGKRQWLWTDEEIERLKAFASSEHDGRKRKSR